jgi:hypothetical protein
MSPSAGGCDYIVSGVFTHPRPRAVVRKITHQFGNSQFRESVAFFPSDEKARSQRGPTLRTSKPWLFEAVSPVRKAWNRKFSSWNRGVYSYNAITTPPKRTKNRRTGLLAHSDFPEDGHR